MESRLAGKACLVCSWGVLVDNIFKIYCWACWLASLNLINAGKHEGIWPKSEPPSQQLKMFWSNSGLVMLNKNGDNRWFENIIQYTPSGTLPLQNIKQDNCGWVTGSFWGASVKLALLSTAAEVIFWVASPKQVFMHFCRAFLPSPRP